MAHSKVVENHCHKLNIGEEGIKTYPYFVLLEIVIVLLGNYSYKRSSSGIKK